MIECNEDAVAMHASDLDAAIEPVRIHKDKLEVILVFFYVSPSFVPTSLVQSEQRVD